MVAHSASPRWFFPFPGSSCVKLRQHAAKEAKNLEKQFVFKGFSTSTLFGFLGALGALLGALGAVLGSLGAVLGHLGAVLGLSWAVLGLS